MCSLQHRYDGPRFSSPRWSADWRNAPQSLQRTRNRGNPTYPPSRLPHPPVPAKKATTALRQTCACVPRPAAVLPFLLSTALWPLIDQELRAIETQPRQSSQACSAVRTQTRRSCPWERRRPICRISDHSHSRLRRGGGGGGGGGGRWTRRSSSRRRRGGWRR